jgi:hypothetical protein
LKKVKSIINLAIYFFRVFLNKNYYFTNTKSQSENKENKYINKLSNFITNKLFVEIGFQYNQFNCVNLIKKNFNGILIDGGGKFNFYVMRAILWRLKKKKIKIINKFINKKNILEIIPKKIVILSIDIDGNDYWILNRIIKNKIFPEIIIIEYNASFLDKKSTIPYKENFHRHDEHISGWYHGASLNLFYNFLKKYNYKLIKTTGGINAFFAKNDIIKNNKIRYFKPEDCYQEGQLRNKWSKTNANEQYNAIKNLPLVKIN